MPEVDGVFYVAETRDIHFGMPLYQVNTPYGWYKSFDVTTISIRYKTRKDAIRAAKQIYRVAIG